MPRPRVEVFLDNDSKGTLQEGQNVMTVDAVAAGAHKLVILAKNQSSEVIDRKEINFTAEPRTTVAQSSVETYPAPRPPPTRRLRFLRRGRPSLRRACRPRLRRHRRPHRQCRCRARTRPRRQSTARLQTTLPETASSTPLLGAAGIGLILTGLAIRRRS